MKSLAHITEKVYGRPWLILPRAHKTIASQLDNILTGKAQLPVPVTTPDPDEEPENDQCDPIMGVAVICVDGIIGKHLSELEMMCGGCDCDGIARQLRTADADENVDTIVMIFNTPGGTATGVPELAALIADVATRKDVVGFTDTLCASAGYYLASQCTRFYCSPSSDVGSVGVYALFLDESAALAMEGIKINAIQAGKYKLMGASFQPMTDEERSILQADVTDTHTKFKAAVMAGRPGIKESDLEGQCFNGEQSAANGFSDGLVNDVDELMQMIASVAISNKNP